MPETRCRDRAHKPRTLGGSTRHRLARGHRLRSAHPISVRVERKKPTAENGKRRKLHFRTAAPAPGPAPSPPRPRPRPRLHPRVPLPPGGERLARPPSRWRPCPGTVSPRACPPSPAPEQVRNAGAYGGDLEDTKCPASVSRSPRRLRGRPNPQSAGARGPGAADPDPARAAAPAEPGRAAPRGPRREPAGPEKRRPERRQTPLRVRLHLLHVAHTAPAAAPGGEEPNVPHRDRGLHQPLSAGLAASCDVQIKSSPDANSPPTPLLSKLCFVPSSERSAGGKSGAKSPADEQQALTPGLGAGRDPPSANARGVFPFSQ
ncbi:uncharacterized protein [Vulpes vulpes]|uniref:Basic proline-rich protein-like n=1 Tax=Vulpes vulpes TaxID=9627 RepID=A0ABM5AP56_VULVU